MSLRQYKLGNLGKKLELKKVVGKAEPVKKVKIIKKKK